MSTGGHDHVICMGSAASWQLLSPPMHAMAVDLPATTATGVIGACLECRSAQECMVNTSCMYSSLIPNRYIIVYLGWQECPGVYG